MTLIIDQHGVLVYAYMQWRQKSKGKPPGWSSGKKLG
jgi:hypothetical protein